MPKKYIICLEQKSIEGTLLFWKAGGKGYTSHLEDAGLFEGQFCKNMNLTGRDLAVTKKELEQFAVSIYTVVDCPLSELQELKNKLREVDKQ